MLTFKLSYFIKAIMALSLVCLFVPAAMAQGKKSKQTESAPAPVPQGPKKVVAVLDPVGDASVTRMNKALARGTMEEFISRSRDYSVVDRSHTDQIMAEMGYQRESGMVSDGDAKSIGKQLGADFVCVSEILKEDGEANLTVAIINVESGIKDVRSAYLETDANRAIADEIADLASSLLGVETKKNIQARREAESANKETDEKAESDKRARRGETRKGIMLGLAGIAADAVSGDGGIRGAISRKVSSAVNGGSGSISSGTVRETGIKYDMRIVNYDGNDRVVRIRFNSQGLTYSWYTRITWELVGASNVMALSGTTSVNANNTVDVILRPSNRDMEINPGTLRIVSVSTGHSF